VKKTESTAAPTKTKRKPTMPTYDFICPKCNAKTSRQLSITGNHTITCECGELMNKIFTTMPIIFKGNGWAAKE
jgi:putative FmdB family regulatory protein